MTQVSAEFGKWRSMFWPIHRWELKKLLPMFFMLFFILFNYTVLRDLKDVLVTDAAGGSQMIPFLKVWGTVPGAIIFTLIYAKLSNMLSKQNLFYVTIIPFILFFGLFALVIYPNVEALQPDASAAYLENLVPKGLIPLVLCYRWWPYSLFYILSELWGSAVVSLLFWGFANDITHVKESKRFYTVFLIGANVALLFSGPAIAISSTIQKETSLRLIAQGMEQQAAENLAFGYNLNVLMAFVVLFGLAIMALYRWINSNVLHDPRFYTPEEDKKIHKAKPKMSLGQSFKYLATNPYILALATIVLAYGLTINFVEVIWKNQIKLYYPDKNDYAFFMGLFSTFTGVATIFLLFFVSGHVIRKLGWGVAAIITPIVLLITGVAFLFFILFRESFVAASIASGGTILFLAVLFGTIQNIASKSSKYSLFDPTKEMAYIPLDQEQKVKGKAAIDVLASRLGKSGGALTHQVLLVIFAGVFTNTYVAIIGALFILVIFAWMQATRYLGKEFNRLTEEEPPQGPPAAGGSGGEKKGDEPIESLLAHSKTAAQPQQAS